MRKNGIIIEAYALLCVICITATGAWAAPPDWFPGDERAIPHHLRPGDEHRLGTAGLIAAGQRLFTARWTSQDGQGRPFAKGNGKPLTDPQSPLVFPRNFNRLSGPDTGACGMCHNTPLIGGGGDFAFNVFVGGERFDFITFDPDDTAPLRGTIDETGRPSTLQRAANPRKVVGMFGSGFVEMLARQMTAELQRTARQCGLGRTCDLSAKGVSFGKLRHKADGGWDTQDVVGLPAASLETQGTAPPSLVLRPLHQSGSVVSLRQFANEAFNQHHGMQSAEMFPGDPDGDGVADELSEADITAVSVFMATLPVPGRVVPKQPLVRNAIAKGERLFEDVGCSGCHIPALPLVQDGWRFSEPNPYNPGGSLQAGSGGPVVEIDLTSSKLPPPRLAARRGVVLVPAYTDLKLHDITTGKPSCAIHPELIASHACDGDVEPLDLGAGPPGLNQGNGRFLTRKLWGVANQHAFGHHGQYTTLREAVQAHFGEAGAQREAFLALSGPDQDAVIEFLKSLQILEPGTPCQVVDENYACTNYQPRYLLGGAL